MASQSESSNTTVQALRVNTGNVTPGPKSPVEHPATLTQKHLSGIYQHLQACVHGVNACKSTCESYENELRELRKQYDTLACDNQYYENLFEQYEDIHQDMQKCMQSIEDRERGYESTIIELRRVNQEAEEKLSVALARIGELEGKVVTTPQSPAQHSPKIAKRQKPANMTDTDLPEKKRGRHLKHPKLMKETKRET